MFDTHCHLNFEVFRKNCDLVIKEARRKGVSYFLIPGVDKKTSLSALAISQEYQKIYSSAGIHPTIEIKEEEIEKNVAEIEKILLLNEKVPAVGEIGLDYYHLKNPASIQRKLFKKQLRLAIKYRKSVIVHSRHSSKDLLDVLSDTGLSNFEKSLVFHCCEPENILLKVAVKNNFFIGVDGDVTYDFKKREFIKEVPLDNIVLETDSPFLTPRPEAKKLAEINSPQNLTYVLEEVSKIKNKRPKEVSDITTRNALLLFGLSSGYNEIC